MKGRKNGIVVEKKKDEGEVWMEKAKIKWYKTNREEILLLCHV